MKKIKDYFMKRKMMCILGTCIVMVMIIIMVYFCYQNTQQKTLESMKIIFNGVTEIEYGTKDYDVEKGLIQEIKNAEIKNISKIDTMKIGEQTLQFTLVNDGLEKQVEYKINVVDTKAPEIKLKKDSIELSVGDSFDISSNISSVKDKVDGDISFNVKVLDINKKATEEYNRLDTKNINKDTKVANKLLSEFLIEDNQGQKEKNLYLKNCYYFDSSVDVSKTGKNKVNIVAIDKNGLKTIKEFTVIVKEKEVKQSQRASVSTNNQGSSSSQSSHTTGKKGSIQDVMNTANAQVGKKYVLGGKGPDSFDCDGLVLYAFKQNGYSMPSSSRRAGYSIGTDLRNARAGDIIVTDHHVRLYLGGMNTVQAFNPRDGIRSGYDKDIDVWYRCHVYNDPNYSNPIEILDIRRVE